MDRDTLYYDALSLVEVKHKTYRCLTTAQFSTTKYGVRLPFIRNQKPSYETPTSPIVDGLNIEAIK